MKQTARLWSLLVMHLSAYDTTRGGCQGGPAPARAPGLPPPAPTSATGLHGPRPTPAPPGQQDSLLMLAGVEPYVLRQMERTGILRTIGRENVFPASEGVGTALLQAVDAAEGWIAARGEEGVGE